MKLLIVDDEPDLVDQLVKMLVRQFYRVEKSRSAEYGGSGLGLSIVKHIIELHGGSISIESEPSA